MSSVSVKRGMALPFGRIGAALLCALPMQPAQARAVIAACVDQSSPAAMMDERVAQAAAVSQGYGLHVEHFDGQGLGDDAYSPDNFRKLAGGLCQLVLGFPVDAQAPLLPDGLQATNPYAQTGFVLVTRDRPPPAALADLPKGTTVAVTFQTAPNLFLAAHSNLVPAVYTQDASSVDAVASGKVKAAMIWQPSVARYVESHPKAHKLFVQRIDEPHARWNLVALYAPESAAAAAVFDQGVAQLHEAGHLAFLVKPFAVDSTASSGPQPALPLSSRYELPRRNSGQLVKVANAPKAAGGKLPALYTKEQATAGLQSYALNCSFCHGAPWKAAMVRH